MEFQEEREDESLTWKTAGPGFRLTTREYEILEFILDQKFSGIEALYSRFFAADTSRSPRYCAERIQLLRRHGLIRAQSVYTSPKLFYLLTPLGRDLLQAQRPDRRLTEVSESIDLRTFNHDWRVTLCRASREKSGHATNWISEKRIKAAWATHAGTLSREYCPDAIYTNRRSERVAFELELAPKTRERHAKKISKFLDTMRDESGPFRRTLFVVCDDTVRRTLEALTRPYPEEFRVMGYSEVVPEAQSLAPSQREGEPHVL